MHMIELADTTIKVHDMLKALSTFFFKLSINGYKPDDE